MHHHRGGRLYSASDLVNFMGCVHATALDIRQLAAPVALPPPDEQTVLLQQKGVEHERAFLKRLREEGRNVVEIAGDADLDERASKTLGAMRSGADVIYQGALMARPWHGYSDFLLKVRGRPSKLGDFAYDVADTKLSRTAKPKHILQLCVYADLLAAAQGTPPDALIVALGDGRQVRIPTKSVEHYFRVARARFEAFVSSPRPTIAEPCGHCGFCRWSDTCNTEWERTEHLSLVAGMTRSQAAKLRSAGVTSLGALAATAANFSAPKLSPETFQKLRAQASLQHVRRSTGEKRVELLPLVDGKGFNRLPKPDAGDLFFDMEGDPLFDGGLEYLFGFIDGAPGQERYTSFWAHDREEEKKAFEAAIDFITARLAQRPDAHVYHYAHYEPTSLKRLAMFHGTREGEVDDLLRQGRLVDLYKVVREAIRASEPGYSIKNLEVFYLGDKRGGEVKSAGDSIVAYERWRRIRDEALLRDISDYNELDCISTQFCRDWLVGLRPGTAAWRPVGEAKPPKPETNAKRRDEEERTAAMAEALRKNAPADQAAWREMLAHLLEFHRREAKPEFWAMYSRIDMTTEELIDDSTCIGGLQMIPGISPIVSKRSSLVTFSFPPQDFKLRAGADVLRAGTGEPAGEITGIDEESRQIQLLLGPSRSPLVEGDGLLPTGPVGDKPLRAAVYRYADAVVRQADRYRAVTDVMSKHPPRLVGRVSGAAIVAAGSDIVEEMFRALMDLDQGCLLVQGPPGAGKTYTSSQVIAKLLARGKTIGVASNSHKAINNLLVAVQRAADVAGVRFAGVKKSSKEDQFVEGCRSITNTTDNDEAVQPGYQLVAGTAWLFAREDFDQRLDYLFVDEAGQVSLANIVATGVSAKNIVLVGDQMQLSQPIQGAHPGGSGISTLEHLLGDLATVPPERGIFLEQTRRMHPLVCKFISDAVYDGRLKSHEATQGQRIIAPKSIDDGAIAEAGLRFIAVDHAGNAQRSVEEAARLKATYERLLRCEWINEKDERRAITPADILVVSPYNMQVEHLKSVLPAGARVGTVDKFQGQEAAVVLISMATSSGDDLPRQIEFLYSRNRLNVAISRARCLAVIFASPRLLEIPCSTIEQMMLVNTLCWANAYAEGTSI